MDAGNLPEGLAPDELVDAVLKGSREPQTLSVLKGFLGTSDAPGYHRLFTDATFKRWFDIPDNAIRHWRRMPAEQDACGGTVLWVEAGALLVSGEVISTSDAEAAFLTGALSAKARVPLIDEGIAFAPPPSEDAAQGGSPDISPEGRRCCPFQA
jgi:hypothetical protein